MNTYTLGSSYNGALGQYQIQNILNIDSNLNTVVSANKEIYFNTGNNQKTKIDSNGILRVYHPFTSTLPTVSTQWMSVEDALIYLLQEDGIWNADSLHNIAQFQATNANIGVVANTANLALAAGTAAGTTSLGNSTAINTINNTTIPNTAANSSNYTLNTSNVIMTNVSNNFLLLSGGSLTGDLKLNYNTANIQLGSLNIGNNIAIAAVSCNLYSASATTGDMVIRSANNMFLQSGIGTHAIKIPTTTNIVEIPSLTTSTAFLYKGTELSSTLAAKENVLTFNAPLTRTTNTIGIDLSNYQPKISTYTVSGGSGGSMSFASGILTLTMPTSYTSLSIASLTTATSFIYKGAELSTSLASYLTSATASTTYLKVDGTTDCSGKITVLNGNSLTTPGIGTYGSAGARIILYKADALSYPYAIGMNSSTMWYSATIGGVHNFYIGGTSIMMISSSGAVVSGISAATSFTENGVPLSTTYQPKINTYTISPAGTATFNAGTLTFDLSAYQTSASLGTTYLKLDGTNWMTGSLGIGTSILSSFKLDVNGNARVANGGSATVFYVGGGANSAALYLNDVVGASWQLITNNSNLIFKNGSISTTLTDRITLLANGNVGIGITNPGNNLFVRGGIGVGYDNGVSLATVEAKGDVLTGVFGGDVLLTSYWGIAMNLNFGGSGDNSSAGATKILYTSSFTINTKSTGTSTTFDKTLFTVRNSGNVGIGTNNPNTKLHIEHASTSANASAGGLYLYNPNTGAGNCSIYGARINGNVANRCGISLDVSGWYGWNIGINGNDTSSKLLRFNASWDNSGSDRMTIDYAGNVSINTGDISSRLTVNNLVSDRSSYDHSQAVATFTNQTTTGGVYNDPKPVLNLCRQGQGGVAYGARATFALSRYENNNVYSRTRMDLLMAHDSYNDNTVMTFYSDGETTLTSRLVITGGISTYYNITAATGFLPANSGSGILYWGAGAGSTVTPQNCSTNVFVSLYCYYAISANTYISISDKRIKENIKPLLEDKNVKDVITKLNPVSYNFIETKQKASGFIAQELGENFPDAVSSTDNFIPNILEEATITDNVITFNNTNKIELIPNNIIKIAKNKNEAKTAKGYMITSVIDENSFTILDTEARNLSGDIYLYGMLVNDYMSVDYNQITTLNTKAIQDLYSIIDRQQQQINDLIKLISSI